MKTLNGIKLIKRRDEQEAKAVLLEREEAINSLTNKNQSAS